MITDRQFVLDPAILSAVNLAAIKKQKKRSRKNEKDRERKRKVTSDNNGRMKEDENWKNIMKNLDWKIRKWTFQNNKMSSGQITMKHGHGPQKHEPKYKQ